MSAPTGLVLPIPVDDTVVIQSYDLKTGAGGDGGVTANVAYLVRFRVLKAETLSSISYWWVSTSGNVDVGIYSDDGATYTRLSSNGGTPTPSGGSQIHAVTFSAAQCVPGINYAMAFALDSASVSIRRSASLLSNGLGIGRQLMAKASSYPLPATIASASAAGTCPWMAVT